MTKNELLALLAELKDEDVIDDKLPKQRICWLCSSTKR